MLRLVVLCMAVVVCRSKVKDSELRCGACERTTEAILSQLEKGDPNARIQVGGRITSQGGGRKFVKFQRSEVRLTEIMEDLCKFEHLDIQSVGFRADTKDWEFLEWKPETEEDRKEYPRVLTTQATLRLKRLCRSLLDEHEEAMISYLFDNYAENLDLRNQVCHRISKFCPTEREPEEESSEEEKTDRNGFGLSADDLKKEL